MSKKCTPLWREAHFQVKMYKAHHSRTTFGSWDVEKVHAVVARSTFPSQNVQNTILGPLLEVEMSKKCTPLWREAHFEVKMYKTHHSRTTFGSWDVEKVHAVVAQSTFRSQHVKKTPGVQTTFGGSDVACFASLHYTGATLHYTTLHYITLHYTPLHYITLHSTTLQLHNYTPLHSNTLHYTALPSTTLHYITLRSTTLQLQLHNYTPLQYTPLRSTTLNYTTLHYTPLHYITLHYLPLHFTTLHYTTLHYTTTTTTQLHSTTLHYTKLHYTTLHYTTLHYIPLHSTTLHYITLTLHYTEWHCTTDRQVDRQIDRQVDS